jgi:hypothetical protein
MAKPGGFGYTRVGQGIFPGFPRQDVFVLPPENFFPPDPYTSLGASLRLALPEIDPG